MNRKIKQPIVLLLIFSWLALVSLTACGGGAETSSTTNNPVTESVVETEAQLEIEDNPQTGNETVTEETTADDTANTENTSENTAESNSMESDSEAEMSDETAPETQPEDSTEAETTSPEAANTTQAFQIVSAQSEARFLIEEELRGTPTTVVGVTSQVSGQILINPANPATTELSPIQINARNLATDSDRRNGAIRRFILQSDKDANQFITFAPTALEGLPAEVAVGDTFTFQVTGDLTIRDQTRPETFDVEVTVHDNNQISGLGSSIVQYADYGLFIPDVPFVANVADDVRLEIEFVAVAANS